jgi:Tfp pilus assembly protein PilO
MQQHRLIVMLSVLVMLVIPVIGWFLVAQPQLAIATQAETERLEAVSQVAASQLVVNQLQKDSANLPELQADLDDLRASIPAAVDPSGYIDGLSALAKVANVQISELSVGDPQAYAPAEVPEAAAPPAPDPSATPAATPVEAPPVVVEGLTTNPLVDGSNFVAIPVEVTVKGKSATILRFVHGLQSNDRLFLVTELTTEPAADTADSGQLLGKVTGYIWAIPTGVAGDPRPVSTIVKSMDPPKPPETETEGDTPDPGSTETPDPNPTETANP